MHGINGLVLYQASLLDNLGYLRLVDEVHEVQEVVLIDIMRALQALLEQLILLGRLAFVAFIH